MTGRYSLADPSPIMRRFGLQELAETHLRPRFNVAPTQLVPIIVDRPEGRELRVVKWGFRPLWMTGPEKRPPPHNARLETLLTSPLFRRYASIHRCLIPATGYYVWRAAEGQGEKQPLFVRLTDQDLFAFAGLYSGAREDNPGTCAIITMPPNQLIQPIQDRMPAILQPQHEAAWLDRTFTDAAQALTLLTPYPSELMEAYEVSPLVNKAGADSAEMVARISGDTDIALDAI